MILSMTGYGCANSPIALVDKQEQEIGISATLSVELRSVNARFLDLTFRLPDEVRTCEPVLRELLTQGLSRGKVECRVQWQQVEPLAHQVKLDETVLQQIHALSMQATAYFPHASALRLGEILRWPGLLKQPQFAPEILQQATLQCTKDALAQLQNTRQREGAALANLMLKKVEAMLSVTAKLAPLVPELLARHQQRLTDKLNQAMMASADIVINQEEIAERVCRELTVYGLRIDVDEELARLNTHLCEVKHILTTEHSPVGKRLDFMMQELNREANTLGSKAITVELSNVAMELKLLIEQMREQIQNLE